MERRLMTFVAGAIIWGAYTLAWWGWEALTDRVPPGEKDTFWWPSIRDLVSPGRQAAAVPPRLLRSTAGTAGGLPPGAFGVDSQGNPLTGTPGTPGGPPLALQPQPGKYTGT
jgi:hypothetical protein